MRTALVGHRRRGPVGTLVRGAMLVIAVVAVAGPAGTAGAAGPAGASGPAGSVRLAGDRSPGSPTATFHPVVVQEAEARLPGPGGSGVRGPVTFRARFAHPTHPGDLLVAAVVDGVRTLGTRQPRWDLAGWQLGADVIGGDRADGGAGGYASGGLQAAIFFYPDSPGGVTSVRLGRVPAGTTSDATAVVAEIAGVPRALTVAAAGTSSSGPTTASNTLRSTVATHDPVRQVPALVLAAFTNGGMAPHGERFVRPSRWQKIGEDRSLGNVDQPLLLDQTVWRTSGRPHQTVEYLGGSPIDNCAVIVALHQERTGGETMSYELTRVRVRGRRP